MEKNASATNESEIEASAIENSVCFQYCIGNESYIQYGCIVAAKEIIEKQEWQPYIQRCLEHFFITKSGLLKENEYMDVELYDTHVILYPHRVALSVHSGSPVCGDYNLYIDVPNHYYAFNGHKSIMLNDPKYPF